jgi:hypothetical protein
MMSGEFVHYGNYSYNNIHKKLCIHKFQENYMLKRILMLSLARL